MSSESRPSIPLGAGSAAGAATFAVGYLVTYLWQADRVEGSVEGLNAVLELVGAASVPVWQAVGWLYYGAHHVPVALWLPGRARVTRSLVGTDGASTLLYLLPPVLLAVAGFAVARYVDAREPTAGAIAGASLLPGYAVLAAGGLLLTRYTAGEAAVAPPLATGLLLAGIAYPAVAGTLGGLLGGVTR